MTALLNDSDPLSVGEMPVVSGNDFPFNGSDRAIRSKGRDCEHVAIDQTELFLNNASVGASAFIHIGEFPLLNPAHRYIQPYMTTASRFWLLAGLATFAGIASADAASAPAITPTADSFVNSASPGSNYGAAGALEVSAVGSAKGEFDSFVRFNLASTMTYFNGIYGAGNWTVSSITLQLTSTAPNNAIFNSSAAGAFKIQLNNSDAWVEGTGTPSAPDTTATDLNYTNHTNYESSSDPSLGMYSFAGGTSGSNTYSLTLSTGLLADVQAGSDASLYVSAADTAVSYLFNSTNFGTAASRPQLVVNAIPEPSTAGLLLGSMLAIACVGVVRARRHTV